METYLLPTVRGERIDCLAMTEPGAGSDVRSMTTRARHDGGDWVINGTKHFISYADMADFVVLFAVTGTEPGPRGRALGDLGFLVDHGTPGFTVSRGRRRSRTAATTTASWRSPTAGSPAPPCLARRGMGSTC